MRWVALILLLLVGCMPFLRPDIQRWQPPEHEDETPCDPADAGFPRCR